MRKIEEIINEIYENVFCKTFNRSCYVFLCGGASENHIRNKLRKPLEKKQFQILYPEDLFMEMLNKNKKADLLEYENLLADNSDVVCVICESMGSAVELGAFVQNEDIKKKMIVAINSQYSRDKSFVMMGPVKHLRKTNPDSVIIFKDNDLDSLIDNLSRKFWKLQKSGISNKNMSFDTLSTYIAFIPIIVYFYRTISRKALYKNMKLFLQKKFNLPSNYNDLFNVSIKYLIKVGILITEFDLDQKDETFSLSLKGYYETFNLVNRSSAMERTMLHDRIRCAILKEQLNK